MQQTYSSTSHPLDTLLVQQLKDVISAEQAFARKYRVAADPSSMASELAQLTARVDRLNRMLDAMEPGSTLSVQSLSPVAA